MPIILSLETSTSVCSAAIHENGKLLTVIEIHQDQSHASKLAILVEKLFQLSGIHASDLNAIAVSAGPGSYTGLRIGVSTAKGLCFSRGIPLITIDALQLMVWKVFKQKRFSGLLCPMIDARRMEVYCCLFNDQLQQMEPIQAKILDEKSFDDYLGGNLIHFFGNSVEKCAEVIRHPNASFIFDVHPSAVELGELAFKKFEQNQFDDLIHYEPLYLKEFLVKKSTKLDGVLNK
jgi:tRNA threonylcarbamoyladenosine biosynthesis protein TsaB